MGCGSSSSQPPKRENRSHSQVTVAAQQRAEAAYRRQRMAQEREQTAVLRAEMEVERARLLKEMTGGSRRPSYCLELEDLKEEAPHEVHGDLNKCLQDFFVEEKNAKNSPFNGYSTSAKVIKSESRGESVEEQNIQEQVQADDENGNTERRNNTAQHDDQDCPEKRDFLQAIARSAQASPSNVYIEENEQTRDHLPNGDETREQIAEITDRSRESNKHQDVPIIENTDTSQDQSFEKPANNDMETSAYEASLTSPENRTNSDGNQEIKMEHNPAGLEQVQDTSNNVNSDLIDSEPIKITSDLNAEQMLSSHSRGSVVENGKQLQDQQQQQDGTELSKNIDNGLKETETVDLSTNQDLQALKREKDDIELDESNVTQQMTSGNEKTDQL